MAPALKPASIHGRASAIAAALALVLLAQAGGGPTYNLGTPQVPGTRIPESNPGTAVATPQSPPPGAGASSGATNPASGGPSGESSGPGYSFGAAPPPVTSPGR
jgi:hypothetical protein